MIDDTPEVRWSTAWWRVAFLGIALPVFFIGLAVTGMIRQEAYLVSSMRHHPTFTVIQGVPARLTWIAYAGAALAAFAHGYLRNHSRLDFLAGPLTALGLLTTLICITWAVLLNAGIF